MTRSFPEHSTGCFGSCRQSGSHHSVCRPIGEDHRCLSANRRGSSVFVCQSARDHRCLSANRRRIIGVYPPIAERSSAFIRPSARDCPCLSANRRGIIRCLSANRRGSCGAILSQSARIIGVCRPIAEGSSVFVGQSPGRYPHFCPLIATDNPILPACCRRCSGSGGPIIPVHLVSAAGLQPILLFFRLSAGMLRFQPPIAAGRRCDPPICYGSSDYIRRSLPDIAV